MVRIKLSWAGRTGFWTERWSRYYRLQSIVLAYCHSLTASCWPIAAAWLPRVGLLPHLDCPVCSLQVEAYAGTMYDAVYLYALALHETVNEGGQNIRNGLHIAKKIASRVFEGNCLSDCLGRFHLTVQESEVNTAVRKYSLRAYIWVVTPLGYIWQFRSWKWTVLLECTHWEFSFEWSLLLVLSDSSGVGSEHCC